MRYQRNILKGSRPQGLGHPHPTQYTAASYHAKYKGSQRLTHLLRLKRMERKENKD